MPPLAPRRRASSFFLARARAVKPDFRADDAVAEICRAPRRPAARARAGGGTHRRRSRRRRSSSGSSSRLPLLTGGARDAARAPADAAGDDRVVVRPPRRSEEQSLFARLAVFRGGCTLEAAEEVVGREPRHAAVARRQEPAPALAGALLDAGDDPRVRRRATRASEETPRRLRQRHADYFLRLAEEAEPHLTGAQQRPWLERLEAEHDNFRLSLDSLRRADRGDEELRLVGALMRFWYVHGHLREGSSRCEEALAAHDDQSVPRVKALFGACCSRTGLATTSGHSCSGRSVSSSLASSATPKVKRARWSAWAYRFTRSATTSEQPPRGGKAPSSRARKASPGFSRWRPTTWAISCVEQGDYAQARALLRGKHHTLPPARRRENGGRWPVQPGIRGRSRRQKRRGGGAPARESRTARALLDKELAIWCLERAGGARRLQRRRRAGGQAHRRDGDVAGGNRARPPQPDERLLNEQTRVALASMLGEERIAAAGAIGREMTFEQAVAYALESQAS